MNNQLSGWLGEKSTAWGLSQGLDPRHYQQINDVIIPKAKGATAQLDHVLVSQFGIFVVETKNRNGVILGKVRDQCWQQINGGRIYEFQNPILQNESHIRALVQLTHLPRWAFHSIIYFCGETQFRHSMPFNVRAEGITTVVKSKCAIVLWPDEVNHVWQRLWECKNDPHLSPERHLNYVNALRWRLNLAGRQFGNTCQT